jgi:hypothetical protein
VAQDFWASSGFRHLARTPEGWLAPTDDYLRHVLARPELAPPSDSQPAERRLHDRLQVEPRLEVGEAELAALGDPDARENWEVFLDFRDRLLTLGSLEAAYTDLFRRPQVDLAPPLVDLLAQGSVRGLLDGSADPWLMRAGEMFFRLQRVSVEDGRVLAADASTITLYAETGGFGNVGRLLRQQNTPTATVKIDVLNDENAPFYFLRDELFSFVLDLTPGSKGSQALAGLMRRWLGHLCGVDVRIEPLARITDEKWRWHTGLDRDSTAILNALYRGEAVAEEQLARLASLFRLTFANPGDAAPALGGSPVYLGIAFAEDHTLRLKPQNLLVNLPIRSV